MFPATDLLSQIGLVVAAGLTLITLSYVLSDNLVFRLVLYLFIGVAAGYAAAVAIQDIVLPQLVYPVLDYATGLSSIDLIEFGIRALLSVLLLAKLSPRTARLGNPVMAMLAGLGAALAVGGAVQGTILPQVAGTASIFDIQEFQLALQGGYYGESIQIILAGVIVLLATVSTLAYFHFGARSRGNQEPERNIFVDVLAWAGSIFIAIALAALFTGVLSAALGALIERFAFLRDLVAVYMGAQ